MVGKGELRLITHAFVRAGRSRDFVRHPACVTAELVTAMRATYGSLERVPASTDVDTVALDKVHNLMSQLFAAEKAR